MPSDGPPRVSVCILAKNCEKDIASCLRSLKDFVRPEYDEVFVLDTGSSDGTIAAAEAGGAQVISRPDLSKPGLLEALREQFPEHEKLITDQTKDGFLADFSEARQILNDAAANDLIFWIDTDDNLLGGKDFRDYIDVFFSDPKNEQNALFLRYEYCYDEVDGACTTDLWRERVLSRRYYHWKGLCHETMIPRDGHLRQIFRYEGAHIAHKHCKHHTFSDARNYVILREAYDNATWRDPRIEFYLGNACRGLSRWNEAIDWYKKLLRRSGSRDDRYSSILSIAHIYILNHRDWLAIDWLLQATKVVPEDPRAFYGVARCYYALKRYKEVLQWTAFGRALRTPVRVTAADPLSFDFYPSVFEVLSLKELGQVEQALELSDILAKARPGFAPTTELRDELLREANNTRIRESIKIAARHASSVERAQAMIQGLAPEVRREFPEFQLELSGPELRRRHITYVCGKTFETWDFTSLETGVGGSEKMVLKLAQAWVRRGISVDIYGNPGAEGRTWTAGGKAKAQILPIEAFNPKFERDIVIAWRNVGIADLSIKCRALYLDLHDVINPADYTPNRTAQFNGIFAKSKFHAEPLVGVVPVEKLFVSRNGIDLREMGLSAERDYEKVVFCSSADRGLLGVLRHWQAIRKLRNDRCKLHIFYGFTPLYLTRANQVDYQYFFDEKCDRHMFEYAEDCYRIMDADPTVTYHGRVGHKELATHLKSAAVWFYPTGFPEISCMAAMEAQLCGALPVVSDAGALSETVTYGKILPQDSDAYAFEVAQILDQGAALDDYRSQMQVASRARFDLDELAADWQKIFTSHDTERAYPALRRQKRAKRPQLPNPVEALH